jgi:NAD(P)-dependent dehydrogenase (short-subunit alcohol dehydrogenase family)
VVPSSDVQARKVVLVTGASRGIGAATARLAADRGYAVAVNYLSNADAASAVVRDITSRGGIALPFQADASREDDVGRLFEEVDREFGRLDALVNNAGITDRAARVDRMDAARLSRMFSVNVIGPFLCAREAVRRMSTARGGRGGAIVNVSSGAARTGSPNEYVDYAASKGAIDTFTIGLAKEVAADGIRVAGVRPGVTYTDIHASTGEPGRVDRIAPMVPLRRGGQPEEIARAILWLLSDEASYVTGTLLDVTGGL